MNLLVSDKINGCFTFSLSTRNTHGQNDVVDCVNCSNHSPVQNFPHLVDSNDAQQFLSATGTVPAGKHRRTVTLGCWCGCYKISAHLMSVFPMCSSWPDISLFFKRQIFFRIKLTSYRKSYLHKAVFLWPLDIKWPSFQQTFSFPATIHPKAANAQEILQGIACIQQQQLWIPQMVDDGCGSRESFCAKIPPGQCIEENFPGHHRPELCLESNHRQEMVPHWKRVGHWIYTRASQGWRQGFSDMERAVQIARFEVWRLILWSTLALNSFTLDFFRLLYAKGCEAKKSSLYLVQGPWSWNWSEFDGAGNRVMLCHCHHSVQINADLRSSASSSLDAPRCSDPHCKVSGCCGERRKRCCNF